MGIISTWDNFIHLPLQTKQTKHVLWLEMENQVKNCIQLLSLWLNFDFIWGTMCGKGWKLNVVVVLSIHQNQDLFAPNSICSAVSTSFRQFHRWLVKCHRLHPTFPQAEKHVEVFITCVCFWFYTFFFFIFWSKKNFRITHKSNCDILLCLSTLGRDFFLWTRPKQMAI